MIRSIVAYDKNRAIGNGNELLWQSGEMKSDMKRFRTRTRGHAVIMGRKTFESIGMALPHRRNIVVSNTLHQGNGIEVVASFDAAMRLCADDEDAYVIGGGQIYEAAMQHVGEIVATEVQHDFHDADTYFPALDGSWRVTEDDMFPADENNKYPYRFVTYERQK